MTIPVLPPEDGASGGGGSAGNSAFLLENATIACTRSGNAETFSLKTAAGTNPSASDPVRIAFNTTTGGFEVLELTTALSLTLSSGSTLGATSAQPFRIWLTVFNDAGTLRLGAIKCALTNGVRALMDNTLESSTAEGGSGGADSAGVIYTGTAVTSKMMRVLGYLEYTLTTAGTWNTAPSLVRLWGRGDKLPGDVVQFVRVEDGEYSSGTTPFPFDDTIPQNTEGNAWPTEATIAPKGAANILSVSAQLFLRSATGDAHGMALFRDSGANALAAFSLRYQTSVTNWSPLYITKNVLAGSVSSTVFKIRYGKENTELAAVNGDTSRAYGGVMASFIEVKEIMT